MHDTWSVRISYLNIGQSIQFCSDSTPIDQFVKIATENVSKALNFSIQNYNFASIDWLIIVYVLKLTLPGSNLTRNLYILQRIEETPNFGFNILTVREKRIFLNFKLFRIFEYVSLGKLCHSLLFPNVTCLWMADNNNNI